MSNYTKNYIKGSAKEIKFDNGGTVINISLNVEQINALKSDNGYVKLTIAHRRGEDQYGNTHSVYENTYVPKEGGKSSTSNGDSSTPKNDGGGTDDLPF